VSTSLSSLYDQGEVPMKLYLTVVMLTRQPPHALFRPFPDHYWAELLGYEELGDDRIPGKGTRRIKRAVAALEKMPLAPSGTGWITRVPVKGHGYLITVVPPPAPLRPPYITLPIELWSRGWINVMSARALFAYMCLRLVLAGKPDSQGTHVSSWDRERLAIKDDTWQRGIKELEAIGLVRTDTARVVVDRWSTDLRERKVYFLNNTYLMGTDSPLKPVS
jgi:hypothetical protein